ncbi:MAG: hypothetical protein N3A72_06535 [bacterium]|nr:hypothetical protein [bacterium]
MSKKILVFTVMLCLISVSGFAITFTRHTTGYLPYPTQMHGLVMGPSGYAYVLGGNSVALGDMYNVFYAPVNSDGSVGPWSQATAFPVPSNDPGTYPLAAYIEFSCFEANGYVYRIGGGWNVGNANGANNGDSLWGKIEPGGNITSWGVRSPFPTGIGTGGLWGPATYATINGTTYVYAVSGQADDGSRTPKVFMSVVNPATGALSPWTEVANIPAGMWFNAAIAVQNKLYTFGGLTTGSSGTGSHNNIYKTTINPDGTLQPWSTDTLPLIMWGIYGGAVAYSKHDVFLIGGRRNTGSGAFAQPTIYRAPISPSGDIGTFTIDGLMAIGSSTTGYYYSPAVIATVNKQQRVYLIGGRCNLPFTSTRNTNNPDFGTDGYGLSSAVFYSEVIYTLPSASGPTALGSSSTAIYTVSNGTGPYIWTSSNPAVAQVISYGGNSAIVQALLSGSASITVADAYNDTDTVIVSVSGTDPLTLNPSIPQLMNPGGTKNFTASGGTGNFTWALSNDTVGYLSSTTGATVTFTATGSGSVDLTVSDPGPPAQQKTVTITVVPTSAPLFKEAESKRYIRFELFD